MIRARELSVTLGGRRVLDRISLDVGRGEAVALVGANGAGKTTILRCLLGLVRYRGEVLVGGIDSAVDPIGAKRLIGYMPQVPTFCEETARGSLRFVAALRGSSPKELPGLLERVGLAAHAERPVRNFSTGMRQRLSLAAALVGAPSVLILDEPTASLDRKGQVEIAALLKRLQGEGLTLLLSSHRAEEIRALAHRIVALDEGRVLADGPVAEVAEAVWGEPAPASPVLPFLRSVR